MDLFHGKICLQRPLAVIRIINEIEDADFLMRLYVISVYQIPCVNLA